MMILSWKLYFVYAPGRCIRYVGGPMGLVVALALLRHSHVSVSVTPRQGRVGPTYAG